MSEQEFVEAIKIHAGIIHKVLYLYLDDKEERQDLMQEIQLQAWKSIGRFQGHSRFSTWLYRVALNTVLTFKRRKRVVLSRLDQQDHAEPEVDGGSQSEQLLLAIRGLSDIDKMIITLHLEDYDNGEIAEMAGISKNHVGVKLYRIKSTLKQKLNPQSHD